MSFNDLHSLKQLPNATLQAQSLEAFVQNLETDNR